MGLREDFQRRIEKKQQEIRDLELKIAEARAYIQALQDTAKLLPRNGTNSVERQPDLRPGSIIAKAREAIRKHGKPVYISELLEAVGLTNSKKHKTSLSGSLAGYVRRNEIFTRPAPNTFGLKELGHFSEDSRSEPPDGFGSLEKHETEEAETKAEETPQDGT
jgi:hypothetical protein